MKNRHRTRYVIYGLLAASVVVLLALMLSPKPVSVVTARVTRGSINETLTAEGTSRYHDVYQISAPMTGYVSRFVLEPGDPVTKGMLLAYVYPTPLDVRQQEELTARLESDRAMLDEASERLAQAQLASELAQKEFDRVVKLYWDHVATKEAFEQSQQANESAKRELKAAQARQRAAEQETRVASAALMSAAPGGPLHEAVAVRSPVSGILLQVLQRDEKTVLAGTPLAEIADPTSQELVIDLLSSEAPRVHPGDSVSFSLPGVDKTLHAFVTRVEPAAFTKISPLGIEEKRVNVIAQLPTPEPALGNNYRVDVTLQLWRGIAVKLPTTALFRAGNEWSTFVVKGDKLEASTVLIGHRGESESEVLQGVNPGDEVVLHPSDEVRTGARFERRTED